MRYEVFISYRHGELDGLVAEKLHKMLETYRIPDAIAKKAGKKKLARVFRDREELPTSSNLSDSINEALENSEFLLLICSRRTCGSQWVMREVERFGELRGKDRIITLLIDGEPEEAFPPGLREREVGGETIFVEPLAADIRAATWAESIKLLKEEKLRLLAPVLGCAFDDLRRRHLRRRLQRAAALIGAAFAFTLSFGSFSAWQYARIDREMQLKLENQSYVLAEYSAAVLADGDRGTALLLALAALPENPDRPERPPVRAAERALADALGIYDVFGGFRPHLAMTLPAAPGKILLSPDGRLA
ncbi:MAG: toll/interleukin-1 receptor domain-containing protein, partial [Gracilibacteraceae bacterium]|nr:toll/interleukin-1 receptor domain-containing protein [Gracilibacteraceae bacterium]